MTETKLCELDWFRDIYVKIYNVINVDNALPHPCEITVLLPSDVDIKDSVVGLAWKSSKTLWFRNQPPDYITFAHELIHLIEKDDNLEEFYAHNLAYLAVIFAEKDVVPPTNIIRIYDASIEEILEALRKSYGYNFKSLEEYFFVIGVIPSFMIFETGDGEITLRVDPRYDERLIVMNTITELIGGIEYDKYIFDAVINILRIVKKRTEVGK